jgi:O-antigen ligase
VPAWRWREGLLLLGAFQYAFGYAWTAMGVLLLLLLGELFAGEPVWRRTGLDWSLLVLCAALFFSATHSAWPDRALASTVQFGLGAFVVVRATVLAADRPSFTRRWVGALALGAAAAALLGALGIGLTPYHRAQMPYMGPNAFATTLAVGLVMATGLLHDSLRRRRGRLVTAGWAIGVAGILVGLILTWSRGAWLAAGMGLGALAVATRSRRTAMVVGYVVLLAALAAPFAAPRWPTQAVRVDERPGAAHPVGRLAMWGAALRMAADHPWTGTGFTTYERAYSRYQTLPAGMGPPPHAHNLFLTFAAETGLPGTAALAAFLGTGLLAAWRWGRGGAQDPDRAGLAAIVLGAMVALLGHQLVDGTLLGSSVAFGLYALLGLAVSGDGGSRPEPSRRRRI